MFSPYRDRIEIEELFIVMVLFCVFPTRNIFNFLFDFNFLNCNILCTIQPICAESAVKSQSTINYYATRQCWMPITKA